MMKKRHDLSRAELERIADAVQRCLYFDENTDQFDPGHEGEARTCARPSRAC